MEWPTRSPVRSYSMHLTVSFGDISDLLCTKIVHTLDDLKDAATTECRNIIHETLGSVKDRFMKRIDVCFAAEAARFEHLLWLLSIKVIFISIKVVFLYIPGWWATYGPPCSLHSILSPIVCSEHEVCSGRGWYGH